MFDQEADRIEEENENAIEALEKMWSDSKIAEMVSQAITSGIFTGIDGTIQSLEDALVQFAYDSGDLFGVMGTVVKSELITNLEIAKDTVKELGQIIKDLDLEKFSTLSGVFSFENRSSGRSIGDVLNTISRTSNNIVFDSPLINIEGSVDRDVLMTLESYGEQLTKDIINKISSSIR